MKTSVVGSKRLIAAENKGSKIVKEN